jgi:hypothetical protein
MVATQFETSSRWELYTPDSFIQHVLHGALQESLKKVSLLIHIGTQIVHFTPETAAITLKDTHNGTSLRDAFIIMRWNAIEMQEILNGGLATLPANYTPTLYIMTMVNALREHVVNIHQWARAIHDDRSGALIVGGQPVRQMAVEILNQMGDLIRFLNFANYFVRKQDS